MKPDGNSDLEQIAALGGLHKLLVLLAILWILFGRMTRIPPWLPALQFTIFLFYVYFTGITPDHGLLALLALWGAALASVVIALSVKRFVFGR